MKDYTLPQTPFNVFTDSYICRLTEALQSAACDVPGISIDVEQHPVLMLTNTDRTNATAIGRLTKQPNFKRDYPSFDGKLVVLADDHVDAGACLAGLHSNVRQNGGTVVAISTYSRHPHTVRLQASLEIKNFLTERASAAEIDDALAEIGLSLKTLTHCEAVILASIFA